MQRRIPGWTLAVTAVAIFMVSLDNLVVTNALTSIREDLGASLEALEWTVNAYTLASPSSCSPAPRSATASAAGARSSSGSPSSPSRPPPPRSPRAPAR